jgi:hypothetical protein
MHKLIFSSILWLSITIFSTGLSAERETTAVHVVSQWIEHSADAEMEQVWPGLGADLSASPLMVTFNNGHVYAFNLKGRSPHWTEQKVNGKMILFSPQDHWGASHGAMHPQFAIQDQKAFVFSLDGEQRDPQKIFEILVHERFHQYQFRHFPMERMKETYQDHLNVENLALMQLEEILLAEFLESKGETQASQLEVLKDFMSIHLLRRSFITSASTAWEDHQQTMEGLADYISFKTFDVFPIFQGYSGRDKLADLLNSYAHNPDVSERALKWRYYGVGASIAYALDFTGSGEWKKRVEAGESLSGLLYENLKMTTDELQERAMRVLVAYDFKQWMKKIQATVDKYQRELDGFLSDYDSLEGIPVLIESPKQKGLSGGGMTARTLFLVDGSTISLDDTSTMATNDHAWCLELTDVPYVFQNRRGGRAFKAPEDVKVYIDGQSKTLKKLRKDNAHLSFHTIKFEGKNCKFHAENKNGHLDVTPNGVVEIYFN